MDTVQLIEIGGLLFVPNETPDEFGGKHRLLARVYDSGDCDTLDWPMNRPRYGVECEYWTQEKYDAALVSALYDAREMGDMPATVRVAILPDNRTINF